MNSGNTSKDKKFKQKIFKADIENIKNNFILKKILGVIKKNKSLEIIKYNKKLQRRLNLSINDYKDYFLLNSSIIIELKTNVGKYDNFINISEKEKKYFHIYFDDSKEEIKRYSLEENERIKKIEIIIDYPISSFEGLFRNCNCISSVFFKKFYRINITNMSFMFSGCSSLKEIDFSNFNTSSVINMSKMFSGCLQLKELNLYNFDTKNVKYMSYMFSECSSLQKLNLYNFNTNNVINMSYMFSKCSSLKELNLSNFNTTNVKFMLSMFEECSSLEELHISNFNTDKAIGNMSYMFYNCPLLKNSVISNFKTNNKFDKETMFKLLPSKQKKVQNYKEKNNIQKHLKYIIIYIILSIIIIIKILLIIYNLIIYLKK